MNYSVEKKDQYAVLKLQEEALNKDIQTDFDEITRGLLREDYNSLIISLTETKSIDANGIASLKKVSRLCTNALGLLVVVSKDDDFIEILEDAGIQDMEIALSIDDAIDAVYSHSLENEFGSGEDDYDDEDYSTNDD